MHNFTLRHQPQKWCNVCHFDFSNDVFRLQTQPPPNTKHDEITPVEGSSGTREDAEEMRDRLDEYKKKITHLLGMLEKARETRAKEKARLIEQMRKRSVAALDEGRRQGEQEALATIKQVSDV